ncbi:MAG TPA: putative LPS assembly protein LptD, partial [Sphingobacteriaceae bacterium]|nr:putative LPS assembly protein LptD [Sphingobacteriaceae bacterium]
MEKKAGFLTFFIGVFAFVLLEVQAGQPGHDRNTQITFRDTIVAVSDTLGRDLVPLDSLPSNVSPGQAVQQESTGLRAVVNIVARDSQWVDIENNITYLNKEAKIKYENFELAADYIRINHNTNEVFASGLLDHNGRYAGRPVVIMPGESAKAVDSLKYNFDTGVGVTYGVFSEVDGGYIHASQVKRNQYNEMSLFHGMYSTCNLPAPHTHFGIFINKGIVTETQIVAGPAYMVVEGVHIKPLMIPFGFFPKPDKKASGFMFPSFGEDFTRGFYMRDAGFYLAFNDYWDSEIRGTLYSKGSYEASLRTSYQVRYKYSGGFNLRFASTRSGVEGTPQYRPRNDFNITWNHSQSAQANPGTTFSASVNFGTGSYFQNTSAGGTYNYEQMTQNNMSSSISYGKRFLDGRLNF